MCLPLLIFPCTIKSRSSLLSPAHPGSPGKRAVKRLLWCGIDSKSCVDCKQCTVANATIERREMLSVGITTDDRQAMLNNLLFFEIAHH